MIKKGQRYPRKLCKNGRDVHLLTRGGRPIWLSAQLARAAYKEWLDQHISHTCRVVDDSSARWFEMEIVMPDTFTGSPEAGWTDGTVHLGMVYTTDLAGWDHDVEWITVPGSSVESLPDGKAKHFARCSVPLWWYEVTVDMVLTSGRQGKGITEIRLFNTPITLPNTPYSMPADAAILQADLIAAGFDGATVATSSAPISATIRNHAAGGARVLTPTFSGADIVGVMDFATPITLPNTPYSMPADREALQEDLISAGYEFAVVTLFADEWVITLPDILAAGSTAERRFEATIEPGDPYASWDILGNRNPDIPANLLIGTATNIRDADGEPLREELRAFGAVTITNTSTLP